MGKKNFVPDGSFLTCDKGTMPCRLRVTNHNNVRLYGDNLASEADKVLGQNIFPMGICAITKGPCVPVPLFWDKAMKDITVNGYKLIIDEAQLQCTIGGRISIHFSRLAAMVASNALGAGAGLLVGTNALTRPGGFLDPSINPPGTAPSYLANYRAAETTLPVDQIRWSQKTANRTFTDGRPMESTRDIVMRRGGIARGTVPPLEVVKMSDGGYTSLDNRRGVSSIEGGAKELPVRIQDGQAPLPDGERERFTLGEKNKAALKRLNAEAGYEKYKVGDSPATYEEAVKFRSAKQSATFPLNGSPEVPRISGTPPPGIEPGTLAPPSRATQLISSVSESIQNQKGIARANDFLLRNAEGVARVGKVVGRGLIVVGIVVDAVNIGVAVSEDGNRFGEHASEATGGAVGGLAGAVAGAELGAALGVVGGPVGVLAGGVVGGIIGGIAGSAAGKGLGHAAGKFFGAF